MARETGDGLQERPEEVLGSLTCSRLRVLFVVDSLDIGGAERHVVDLAVALADLGHCVSVACSTHGPLCCDLARHGISVHILHNCLVKRRLSARFAFRLARLVRNQQFDLVHAHVFASEIAAALAVAGTRIPLVCTEHTEAPWRSYFARMLSRVIYRRASMIIAVSRAIQRQLADSYDMPYDRIAVVFSAFPSSRVVDSRSRDRWPQGLPKTRLVAVVGRLQPEKGVEVFLRAVAGIVHMVPDVTFLVVGEGPLRDTLQQLAAHLGIERNVWFLGQRRDVAGIMESLDVLVVPSHYEGTPLVILEAMAASLPVIASDVGGVSDQVSDGNTGILVPPGDPVSLGEAILRLLDDPVTALRFGRCGKRRLEEEFKHCAMVEQTMAVYRKALTS